MKKNKVITQLCTMLWAEGFSVDVIAYTLKLTKRSVIARLTRETVYHPETKSTEPDYFFY